MRTKFVILFFCLFIFTSNADVFLLTLENDIVTKTDEHYTHGTRIGNIFENPKCLENLWENKSKKIGLMLAQHMYTPSNIKTSELIEDDRPYGGWLYLGTSLFLEEGNKQDFFAIDTGITGPYSYSEETQKMIHKWLECTIPQGWDNQIDTELGVDLSYQRKYRWVYDSNIIDADFIPHAGGVVGNIFTYGDLGGLVRIGRRLPNDFGFLNMEPSTRDIISNGYYIFGGCEGRYMARNIFLDGNTFKESHSVDKEEWVGDINYGIGLFYKQFEIISKYVIRSKEFENQKEHNEFGSIILLWRY